jgi:hypothetical protein
MRPYFRNIQQKKKRLARVAQVVEHLYRALSSNHSTASLQKIHEEMFYILNHKGNANKNYNEIPSHLSQNDYHQINKQILARMGVVGKSPYKLLMEMQISAATMEISKEVPQKTKNRTTL